MCSLVIRHGRGQVKDCGNCGCPSSGASHDIDSKTGKCRKCGRLALSGFQQFPAVPLASAGFPGVSPGTARFSPVLRRV